MNRPLSFFWEFKNRFHFLEFTGVLLRGEKMMVTLSKYNHTRGTHIYIYLRVYLSIMYRHLVCTCVTNTRSSVSIPRNSLHDDDVRCSNYLIIQRSFIVTVKSYIGLVTFEMWIRSWKSARGDQKPYIYAQYYD